MKMEDLSETIEILSDPKTMRNIREAFERIKSGDYGISIKDIKKELGLF